MHINKLLIFVICSFLCSVIITFLGFLVNLRQAPIKNEKITKIVEKESDFFARPSGQAIENIIFFINVGILLFIWENSKNSKKQPKYKKCCHNNDCWLNVDDCYDNYNEVHTRVCCSTNSDGSGLCEIQNWLGYATFISFFVITLFVEFGLNFFLISSITYLFRKNKKKRYFRILKTTWKKIILLWKKKIDDLEFILSYIGFALFIVLIAKLTPRCCEIIENHHANCCCCFGNTLKKKNKKS